MTPVFVLFFPLDLAIALTAIVHFLNNLFKLGLMGKFADRKVLLLFGIPALGFAALGAWCLDFMVDLPAWGSYQLGENTYEITPVKLIVSVLIFIFALQDIIPSWSFKKMKGKHLPIGGALSGFFGGLSGHQGALRSMFLLQLGMTKEAFIATGIIIACFIDTSRITIYLLDGDLQQHFSTIDYKLLTAATLSAFLGAYLGKKVLKKITLRSLQLMVGILLIVFSIFMGLGIL